MDINKIIQNLKVLSSIEIKDKISIDSNNDLKIEKSSILRPFSRYLYNNNRTKTYNVLNNYIDESIIYIEKFKINYYKIVESILQTKSIEEINSKIIIDELKKTINGLINLKITYKNDIVFIQNIDISLEKIKNNLL